MMKFIIIIIIILFYILNLSEGKAREPGILFGDGQLYLNTDINKKFVENNNNLRGMVNYTELPLYSYSKKQYSRLDWSFLRLNIRNNFTKGEAFQGFVDFHPRVDEFTTIKIPNSNFIIQDESYTLWVEIPGTRNVTTFTTSKVNVTLPCSVNNTITGVMERVNNTDCIGVNNTMNSNYTTEITESKNSTQILPIILPAKHIFNNETQTFVNYFTIIIQLGDNGRIIDAQWDGDRDTTLCEKQCDSCIDNQCGVDLESMKCNDDTNGKGVTVKYDGKANATTTTGSSTGGQIKDLSYDQGCQVKLFVAWAGIDRNGRACRSINRIPSNFQKYSSTQIKKIGTGLISDFFYRVNDNNNNPNNP